MAKIDRIWFRDKLRQNEETQLSLATFLGVDPSNVSQLLRGKRRLHMETAEKIAAFLRVPLEEVLKHMGLDVNPTNPADFPVIGTVGPDMIVNICDEGRVWGHPGLPLDAMAVRVEAAGSSAEWMDGWVMFFEAPREASADCLLRLCVAGLGDGTRRLGSLRRGYAADSFSLMTCGGSLPDALVEDAAPVLWIKP